jgi:hypothetical protein
MRSGGGSKIKTALPVSKTRERQMRKYDQKGFDQFSPTVELMELMDGFFQLHFAI